MYCKSSSKIQAFDARWRSPHQNTDYSLVWWCMLWHHALISLSLSAPPSSASLLTFFPARHFSHLKKKKKSTHSPFLCVVLSLTQQPWAKDRSRWVRETYLSTPLQYWWPNDPLQNRASQANRVSLNSTQNQNQNQRPIHSVKATNWAWYEW